MEQILKEMQPDHSPTERDMVRQSVDTHQPKKKIQFYDPFAEMDKIAHLDDEKDGPDASFKS